MLFWWKRYSLYFVFLFPFPVCTFPFPVWDLTVACLNPVEGGACSGCGCSVWIGASGASLPGTLWRSAYASMNEMITRFIVSPVMPQAALNLRFVLAGTL